MGGVQCWWVTFSDFSQEAKWETLRQKIQAALTSKAYSSLPVRYSRAILALLSLPNYKRVPSPKHLLLTSVKDENILFTVGTAGARLRSAEKKLRAPLVNQNGKISSIPPNEQSYNLRSNPLNEYYESQRGYDPFQFPKLLLNWICVDYEQLKNGEENGKPE